MYDEELARMRAQMLAKEEEEPSVFDDGARFLGQDPSMMQVGLFGRPKKPVAPPIAPSVNLQRRSILGLTPMPADLPAVIPPSAPRPTPQQMEQAVPQQQPTAPAPSAAPSASPLQALADKALNAPISRRDVLKRAGQAALQQVVPMPSITDVIPQVVPPLAAIDTMESLFPSLAARYGIADAFKSGALDAIATGIAEGSVPRDVYYTYDTLRHYLESNVPEKELKRMDKLQEMIDLHADDFSSGEFLGNRTYDAVAKLYELLDKHKKHIPDYAIKDAYIKDAVDKLPFYELEDMVGNNFVGDKSPSPEDLKAYYQSLEPPPPPPMPEKVKAIMKKLGKPKSKGK